MNAVEMVKCRTADDLLNALHPRRGAWPDTGPWFFCGHGNARWKLLPSAHGAKSWAPGLTLVRSKPTSDVDVDFWERELLRRFMNLLGRAGLPIPREESLPPRFQTDKPWPDPAFEPLLALAQHSGVPTRLLDWTLSWKVAAYLAAVDALKTQSVALDVWAINYRFLEVWGADRRWTLPAGSSERRDTGIQISTPRLGCSRCVGAMYVEMMGRSFHWIPC